MQQNIATLDLPKTQITKLQNLGYNYCETLTSDLLNSYSINLPKVPETKTALKLLEEELSEPCIITFHSEIDRVLKDEITVKRITEIAGYPGSGRTQILFQLCITVQLPKSLGGLGGEVIFIDTNKNFSSTRVRQLSENFTNRIKQVKGELLDDLWMTEVLKHIYVFKCINFIDLMACVTYLETFLIGKKVKLLVIDNLSVPIKDFPIKDRTTSLFTLIDHLQHLANIFNFAIVVTNDFTARISKKKETYYTSSFGDTFFHRVNSRICLYKDNNVHYIELVKSMTKESLVVSYNMF